MPSNAKKRKQQRKEAAKARQNEDRPPPTEAEEMASAPLTGIHSLPNETLAAIFSFLPIPDLARCAAVCKRWHEIVMGFTQLGNLRRLRLRDSRMAAGDLEVAVKGMRCLASLQLDCCDLVSDLSCLRHCERLQELEVQVFPPGVPLTGLRYLPAGLRSLHLRSYMIDADELSEAAARLLLLEELDLSLCKLAHLRFLRRCPQLRDLSLYDAIGFKKEAYREVCHVTHLQILRVNYYVRDFVRKVVQPCLPKVKICCCGYRFGLKYND